MKTSPTTLLVSFFALPFSLFAESYEDKSKKNAVKSGTYLAEAPLVEGWPKPSNYNQVVKKSFPAFRSASTQSSGVNSGFMTLFGHISRNKIPMTSPVDMGMSLVKQGDEELKAASMAFLYIDPTTGEVGKNKRGVTIQDTEAFEALVYTWNGTRSKATIAQATKALKKELATQKRTSENFRLFGYNSPGVPDRAKTWELVAILDK